MIFFFKTKNDLNVLLYLLTGFFTAKKFHLCDTKSKISCHQIAWWLPSAEEQFSLQFSQSWGDWHEASLAALSHSVMLVKSLKKKKKKRGQLEHY